MSLRMIEWLILVNRFVYFEHFPIKETLKKSNNIILKSYNLKLENIKSDINIIW